MFKKLMAVAVLLVFAFLGFGCGGDLPKGAVAKVGDKVITQEQFDTRVKEIVGQLKGQAPDKEKDPAGYKLLEQRILDYMITLEIATQEQAALGVTTSDKDVQTQLDQIKQMFGNDETKFQDALKQQNITLDQLKTNLRERDLMTKVAEAVTKDAKVTDEQIAAYYEKHKAEYKQDETRTARHILIAPGGNADPNAKPTDAQWQEALAKAEKVRQEILAGADFATKAKEVSDDPGTKPQGGDLGVVQRGAMVPEFDKVLFSLKKGEISQPVKTQYGYHIIQVLDITPAKQLTLDEVKENIRSQLLDEAKTTIWNAWVADMKKKLNVIVKEGLELTTTTSTTAQGESTPSTGGPATSPSGETTTTAKP
ncbi:MAG: peptidylprolyl isomerase [Thermoleophilia bacterium]